MDFVGRVDRVPPKTQRAGATPSLPALWHPVLYRDHVDRSIFLSGNSRVRPLLEHFRET
jgi:hypothetical protein